MAVQLQTRSRFDRNGRWTCDGETNRNQPTLAMKQERGYIRRQNPDLDIRFVYDRAEFV